MSDREFAIGLDRERLDVVRTRALERAEENHAAFDLAVAFHDGTALIKAQVIQQRGSREIRYLIGRGVDRIGTNHYGHKAIEFALRETIGEASLREEVSEVIPGLKDGESLLIHNTSKTT